MTSHIRRRKVETTMELQIVTNMITSTEYLKEVHHILNPELFKLNYAGRVSRWVLDYFTKYGEAPGNTVQSMFLVEKDKIDPSEAVIIQGLLETLSEKFNTEEETSANIPYMVDNTFNYIESRSLATTCEKTLAHIEIGNVQKAMAELVSYKQLSKDLSRWVDPLSDEYIEKVYQTKFDHVSDESFGDFLFKFGGPLGDLLGRFDRGWLVGFMGPMKRGKTWWLQEMAFQAWIRRLNVVFISLEMNDMGVSSRFFKRMTAMAERGEGDFIYPCFDCLRNQEGSCKEAKRTNTYRLLDDLGNKPKYTPRVKYKPCTVCRGTNAFIPATWFEPIHRKQMTLKRVASHIQGMRNQYGNTMRFKSYPAFSASLNTILADIKVLEFNEGFIPDVVIVDYADIVAPNNRYLEGRDRIDDVWKALKNLAQVQHCLVVTASQSNRKTLEKKNVKAIDAAEDIRKIAHVDGMFTLNQTESEKRQGVIRVGVASHRWFDYDEGKHVAVLQNLSLGQTFLDSELVRQPKEAEANQEVED